MVLNIGSKTHIGLQLGTLGAIIAASVIATGVWYRFTEQVKDNTEAAEEHVIEAQHSLQTMEKTINEINTRMKSKGENAWHRYPHMDQWVRATEQLNPEWTPLPIEDVLWYNPDTGRMEKVD